MKAGWEVKQLGDIAQVKGGKRVPKGYKLSSEPTDFPYLRVTDFADDGTIDMSDLRYVSAEVHREIKNYVIFSDDLYISIAGTIGKTGIIPEELDGANLTENACRLVFLPGISNRFIYYFTSSSTFIEQAGLNTRTTAQPKLALERLKTISLPIPPLPEQQRIVAILDEAFGSIATAKANAEKNLQNARALFESHLHEVFTQRGEGWVENKLAVLTTKIGSGATPRGGEESYKTDGISLIRSLNVHDYGFKYSKLAFIDDEQADGLSNVVIQNRDVLLNITGASVARCCIVPDDVLPARVNQHVSIIRPISDKLDADFLHYLLISQPYKDQLLQTGAEGGSTRQAITKAQIQDFIVAYPPAIKDQKTIVTELDSILEETQHLELVYQQKLTALDALKKSLLDQAFRGEL